MKPRGPRCIPQAPQIISIIRRSRQTEVADPAFQIWRRNAAASRTTTRRTIRALQPSSLKRARFCYLSGVLRAWSPFRNEGTDLRAQPKSFSPPLRRHIAYFHSAGMRELSEPFPGIARKARLREATRSGAEVDLAGKRRVASADMRST